STSSRSPNSIRVAVFVANVRTERDTSPPSTMRTHATTVSLCTSRPAQRGYITSMTSSPVASPAWGTSIGNSIKRAPDREGHWHNQGCSKCPRSNSFSGSQHHDDDRPLCRRPPSLASVSSSRVGRKGRCVTHSITSSARGEQRWRNGEAERFGSVEIHHKFEFGWLYHRKLAVTGQTV